MPKFCPTANSSQRRLAGLLHSTHIHSARSVDSDGWGDVGELISQQEVLISGLERCVFPKALRGSGQCMSDHSILAHILIKTLIPNSLAGLRPRTNTTEPLGRMIRRDGSSRGGRVPPFLFPESLVVPLDCSAGPYLISSRSFAFRLSSWRE